MLLDHPNVNVLTNMDVPATGGGSGTGNGGFISGGGGGGGILKRTELLGKGADLRLEAGEGWCGCSRGQNIGIAGAIVAR